MWELKGCVTLENKENNKEQFKEKCEFTIHPCNFEVNIKEIKPFNVCIGSFLVLNLQTINNCDVNSSIKIKSKPKYGNLYCLDGSTTLVYKPTICFSAVDMFQILIEDECGGNRIESILIHILC